MFVRRHSSAFSLIEVVVAVAVVAIGIMAVLSMVPGLLRQRAETRNAQVALGLAPAIAGKLQEIATGNGGNLSGQLPLLGGDSNGRLCLVASRDGAELSLRQGSGAQADGDQYFLIEVFQFAHAPLAYTSGDGVLALSARVSWPYLIRAGGQTTEIPPADRQAVSYTISLRP